MTYLRDFLEFLVAVASLALIVLVATQTSKNEGFGTIGVPSPTNFKGKPGFEEQMKGHTRTVAIAFFVLAMLTGLVSSRL